MTTAIYPGTFDPIHRGHIDIIERTSKMFDRLVVVIAKNSKKVNLFSEEERLEMLKKSLSHLDNVEVVFTSGLLADIAKKKEAVAIIRGIRNSTDLDYEMPIAQMNQKISGVTSVFILPDEKYSFLSSTIIREIASFGQDCSEFVPDGIERALKAKFID
jgi:pantetheine-phosphate adenylyltransferase